ncbi:replicative DNA helicase, partial [bacterium]|nr:replicative DNA helicase [bacterium]
MAEFQQRIPPQNLDAEQSLLGSMMLKEEAMNKAAEVVQPEDFYVNSNKIIFEALIALFKTQKPCDPITLQEQLRSMNKLSEAGGAAYISQLLNAVPTASNAEYYANIVRQKAILRRLINVSGDIMADAYAPQAEAERLLDSAEQKILQLSEFRITQPYISLKRLVPEVFSFLERLYEHKQAITGLPSGFKKLDEFTAGFQASDLIIVAARPSMGKTALCLNIAQHVA